MANTLSLAQNLIILCGHFKGIDYRIREHLITKEISIGDYVLTGGELRSSYGDAIVRIILLGVISDEQSALLRLISGTTFLAAPVYTRPADYNGWQVLEKFIVRHEAKIKEWSCNSFGNRRAQYSCWICGRGINQLYKNRKVDIRNEMSFFV